MESAEKALERLYRERKSAKGRLRHRIEVASLSTEGVVYEVNVWENGEIECSCPAGIMGKRCRHWEGALKKLTPFQRKIVENRRKDLER